MNKHELLHLAVVAQSQSEPTLAKINKIAKVFDLRLYRGRGYYYWGGLTEEMGIKVAGLYTSSVGVYHVSHMTWAQWISELIDVLDQLNAQ